MRSTSVKRSARDWLMEVRLLSWESQCMQTVAGWGGNGFLNTSSAAKLKVFPPFREPRCHGCDMAIGSVITQQSLSPRDGRPGMTGEKGRNPVVRRLSESRQTDWCVGSTTHLVPRNQTPETVGFHRP